MTDAIKRRDRFVLLVATETLSRILADRGDRELASELADMAVDLKVGEYSALEFADDVSVIVSARLAAERAEHCREVRMSPSEIARALRFHEASALQGLVDRSDVPVGVAADLQFHKLWDDHRHRTDLGRAVVLELERG